MLPPIEGAGMAEDPHIRDLMSGWARRTSM
jgi:hypothetical protein